MALQMSSTSHLYYLNVRYSEVPNIGSMQSVRLVNLTRAVCSHSLALRIAVNSGLYLGHAP